METKVYAWTPSKMYERGSLTDYDHFAACGEYVHLEDYERLRAALEKIARLEPYPAGVARAALGFDHPTSSATPALPEKP